MGECHDLIRRKLGLLVNEVEEEINMVQEEKSSGLIGDIRGSDAQIEKVKKMIKTFISEVGSENLCMFDLGSAVEIYFFYEGAGRIPICLFDFRFDNPKLIDEEMICTSIVRRMDSIIKDE